MKVLSPETLLRSAIAYLREKRADFEAELLSRCKIEIGSSGQRYSGTTKVGLNLTLRCKASDLEHFKDNSSPWDLDSSSFIWIKEAIDNVLPVEFKIHEMSARAFLVGREEFEKTELEKLLEAQKDLMVSVATGGPRIETKDQDYKTRRKLIAMRLAEMGEKDPNPFEDLWAWYGRWRSGDLPTYQSRRDYVRALYQPLLERLAGAESANPAEPSREPTGWEKVDRVIDQLINQLASAKKEEHFQTIGLLCRECIISLAQAVYNPSIHYITSDGVTPSKTDASRMLEAYFSSEYSGSANEALRRHAKASLSLANDLQHKRTASYKDAALCAEATRTVVNIVAITSGKR